MKLSYTHSGETYEADIHEAAIACMRFRGSYVYKEYQYSYEDYTREKLLDILSQYIKYTQPNSWDTIYAQKYIAAYDLYRIIQLCATV